jgi:putative sterol carrier protein
MQTNYLCIVKKFYGVLLMMIAGKIFAICSALFGRIKFSKKLFVIYRKQKIHQNLQRENTECRNNVLLTE